MIRRSGNLKRRRAKKKRADRANADDWKKGCKVGKWGGLRRKS